MPKYDFACKSCNKIYEMTLTFAEHEILKNKLECQECHDLLIQCIAPTNFVLKGEGWFPKRADEYDPAYHGLNQSEFTKNLELEKKIEDVAMNMAAKETP